MHFPLDDAVADAMLVNSIGTGVTMKSLPAFSLSPLPSSFQRTRTRPTVPRRCPSTIAVASATPASNATFSQWAASLHIHMPSLVLSSFPSSPSRGLAATQPIKKSGTLVTVPSSAALQVTTAADERIPEQFPIPRSVWRSLPWYARLALSIVTASNTDSDLLHQWTNCLPSSIDTPHHWSTAELEQLQSPRMLTLVHDQRRAYTACYNRIFDAVPDTDLSYDLFIWAVDCVRSRAFSGPQEAAPFRERLRLALFIASNTLVWPTLHVIPWENALNGGLTAMFSLIAFDVILPRIQQVISGVPLRRYAMVPGIDMINHNGIDAGDAQVEFRYFTESFEVLSADVYAPGDQVFISYGKQSNDSFLQYYGFVEADNPAETYVFDSEIAQQLGVADNALIARAGGFSEPVMRAVKKRVGGDCDKAVTLLRETCRAQLDRFDTSVEEDTKLLKQQRDDGSRFSMAVQYRREKKKVLRQLVDEWDGKASRT